MRHKITWKLFLYFTTIILLFSLIVGGSFVTLFTNHTEQIYKADMEKKAVAIATGVSAYLENIAEETVIQPDGQSTEEQDSSYNMVKGNSNQQVNGKNNTSNYNAYIKALGDIAMGDVWIVDQSAETISIGTGKQQITYSELPKDAIDLLKNVFAGEVAFSQSFSTLLENPSVTVGAPVFSEDGDVIAAVLLHTHIENMEAAIHTGLNTLYISMAVALVAVLGLAVLLARKFIQPLKKMEQTTQQLANNNYQVHTGIVQNDELGSLAANIDILADKLDEASKESAKLDKMRKEFISSISHELRTPVTVIRGSLEALNDHVVTKPELVDEYHEQMLAESIHLERLINDLLELSRLQNADYRMEMTRLDFVDVVENAIRSVRYIAREKGITISFSKEVAQCTMEGDYTRLRQMLLAVLKNAVKFSKEKGSIEVSLVKEEKGCCLAITDHGPGIPEEYQPYIFDKFFKSNDEINKKGTGLGLAVAKQIANRHHITLTLESKEHEGATFLFLLDNIEQKK